MKEEFNKFTCDSCKKETLENREDGYPYKDGWMYMHRLDFRTGEHSYQKSESDRLHFCGQKCFLAHIASKLAEVKCVGAIKEKK